jgi:hypothetical protein
VCPRYRLIACIASSFPVLPTVRPDDLLGLIIVSYVLLVAISVIPASWSLDPAQRADARVILRQLLGGFWIEYPDDRGK